MPDIVRGVSTDLRGPKGGTRVKMSIFFKNTQNCFAHNSLTKYRSEAVLYSKRTA